MGRPFLLAALGILFLAGGMAAVVSRGTRGRAPAAATERPAAEEPPSDGPAAPMTPTAPPAPGASPTPSGRSITGAGRERVPAPATAAFVREGARPPWSIAGAAPRTTRGDRRRLSQQMLGGRSEVQALLSPCAGKNAQVSAGARHSAPRRTEPGALVLDVEPLDRKFRIVDVPAQASDRLGDAYLACAREALRGQVVVADAVEAGSVRRMAFPIGPASRAAAHSRRG